MENPISDISAYPTAIVIEEFDGSKKTIGMPSISLGNFSKKLRRRINHNLMDEDLSPEQNMIQIEEDYTEFMCRSFQDIQIGFSTPDTVEKFNEVIDYVMEFKV